jgi:xanthine dehydrogenase YagR molybdenum-binding subunit
MATATYPAHRSEASAIARIMPDGTAVVVSGTQDIGTGTYTIMTQVAADALGFPVDRVSFGLGDSSLPRAPISGGSQSAASVSPAVHEAASAARAQLIALARADEASPLHGLAVEDVTVVDGWVASRSQPTKRDPAAAIIARAGSRPIEAAATAKSGDESKRFESHSFGAIFTEIHVDAALGVIRVPRVVAVYDVGRLLNEKTGKSQLMGGLVWGIGAALEEESALDPRYGRFVNGNLAEYHVPVNGDIGTIDVTVLDVPDTNFNPLGARGIGEIGITGIVAAVANGVYHATGVRVRDLPITLDKVMMRMTA